VGWGGSEAAVLWTLEVLKHDYEATLIIGGGLFDLDRLNEYYGTHFNTAAIRAGYAGGR
jgi:hypothetical protein